MQLARQLRSGEETPSCCTISVYALKLLSNLLYYCSIQIMSISNLSSLINFQDFKQVTHSYGGTQINPKFQKCQSHFSSEKLMSI